MPVNNYRKIIALENHKFAPLMRYFAYMWKENSQVMF